MSEKPEEPQENEIEELNEPLEKQDDLDDVPDDNSIEAPKEKKERRPKTQKQLDALHAGRSIMLKNAQVRREARAEADDIMKKRIEEKIVKKAVSIKKKQIMKEAVLDDISDEDIPAEVIQKIIKIKSTPTKQVKVVEPPAPPSFENKQPKYMFV